MGYTPLFDTLTSGTLCGRWPDIGLWPIVLSLADRNGVVDVTPTYIASITGLGVEEVEACMARFCEPDKYSRSREHDGARLIPLDPERPWGWKIVNHGKYREKARKAAYDAKRTESGENAERMATRRDPTRPANTRPQTQTKTKTKTEEGEKNARERATRLPDDFELTPERRLVAETEKLSAERTFAKFRDYWAAESGQKARKRDWDAAWRNWCRKEADWSRGNGASKTRLTRFEELTGGS